MPTLDTRPGAVDVLVYPGNAFSLELTWPSALTSRTFTADLDGTALSVSVVGAVMTITFSAAITAALTGRQSWKITETTSGTQVRIKGRVLLTTSPTAAQDATATVIDDTNSVAVSVLGEPGPTTQFDLKQSARAATTANVTLAGGAPNTLDGVTLAAGDRILVKDQTTASENGVYTVATLGTGANGTWTRATDADESAEVTSGMLAWVNEGTVNGDTGWVLTTDDPIVLGTTALTFTQFSSLGQVIAGVALSKSGSTLDVNVDGSTIEVAADALQVKDGGVTPAKLSFDPATQAELDAEAAARSAGDAAAVQRANHTGTQTASTISDLAEAVQDIVGAAITAGARISVSYNDPAGTITIAVTGLVSTDLSDFTEAVQDVAGGMATDSGTIDFTYDDTAGTLTAVVKNASITTAMLAFDVATQAELDAAIAALSTTYQSVIGTANGTDDTTTIQALLTAARTAGGGLVKGLAGQSYKISAPLVIGSGTTLDMTGCTVTLIAGSNCNMVQNYGLTSGVRDTDVMVRGGIWARGANAGTTVALHSLRFRKCDGLTVRDLKVTSSAGKYAINPGDCTKILVENIQFNVFSDGVHFNGPCSEIVVRNITGTTGDDTVSFTCDDFTGYNDVAGIITDITVDHVVASTVQALLKVTGSASAYYVRGLHGRGLRQTGAGKVAYFQNDTGGLDARDIYLKGLYGAKIQAAAGTITELTVEDYEFVPTSNSMACIDTAATITSLILRNIKLNNATYTDNPLVLIGTSATVTDLFASDIYWRSSTTNLVQLNATTSVLTNCRLNGVHKDGISASSGSLVRASNSGSTLGYVEICNCVSDNTSWVADVITTTTFLLVNVRTNSGTFNVRSGGVVTVYGAGCSLGSVTNAGTFTNRSLDLAGFFPANVVLDTTTGSKIGTGTTQKLGFWNATPIAQPTRAGQLTDNSGGTSGGATIAAVTDAATAANAIATLAAKYNALEAKLSAAGGGSGLTA